MATFRNVPQVSMSFRIVVARWRSVRQDRYVKKCCIVGENAISGCGSSVVSQGVGDHARLDFIHEEVPLQMVDDVVDVVLRCHSCPSEIFRPTDRNSVFI